MDPPRRHLPLHSDSLLLMSGPWTSVASCHVSPTVVTPRVAPGPRGSTQSPSRTSASTVLAFPEHPRRSPTACGLLGPAALAQGRAAGRCGRHRPGFSRPPDGPAQRGRCSGCLPGGALRAAASPALLLRFPRTRVRVRACLVLARVTVRAAPAPGPRPPFPSACFLLSTFHPLRTRGATVLHGASFANIFFPSAACVRILPTALPA